MEEGRVSANNKMHLDCVSHLGLSPFLYSGKNTYPQGVHLANSTYFTMENINKASMDSIIHFVCLAVLPDRMGPRAPHS